MTFSQPSFLLLLAMPVLAIVGLLMGKLAWPVTMSLGAMLFLIVLLMVGQDELIAALILLAHLYVDWYLGYSVVAQLAAIALIVLFFLLRSPRRPWATPRVLWLWLILMLLAISPSIRGITSIHDALYYYPNVLGGGLIMLWLGTLVGRNVTGVVRTFACIAAVGTFLAIVSIFQYKTGILLFGSNRFDASINAADNYVLLQGSTIFRIGVFFVNPDWSGAFFALMLFIPFGLFVYTRSLLLKVVYLTQIILLLPALLFTYSNGAWIGVLAGLIVFIALIGRNRYRVFILGAGSVLTLLAYMFLSSQLLLQIQHATGQRELSLREGAWETGLRVMKAFPLSGIGLGLTTYLERAEPYRVPAQYVSLAHPHNSYIELGAMGGIPLVLVFIALLLFALWRAWKIHSMLDPATRALFAGGIAAIVVISVNSFSINEWTLPPLSAFGWLILGVLSSPLLQKSVVKEDKEDKENVQEATLEVKDEPVHEQEPVTLTIERVHI